jgi:hypothetical protein
MKKLFYFFLIIALSKNVLAINFPERIMSSYRLNDIFKIKEQLKIEKLTDQQRLFLSAVVNNAFALNNKSAEEINKYINDYPEEYSDTLYIGLLQVQLDNYIKLNNYAEAANTENTILTKAAPALKEKEITDNKNSFRIWNALRNSKPQEVIKNGKPVIEYTKDVANLINVVAECNNIKQHAIFDTGAKPFGYNRQPCRKDGHHSVRR